MGRIVLKWGGGVITEKSAHCIARREMIASLSECAVKLAYDGHEVIIVHGAGSFGHIDAKHYRLNEGYLGDLSESGINQIEGVDVVRKQMNCLNSLVHDHLSEAASRVDKEDVKELLIITHEPRDFALNSGADFTGDIDIFALNPEEREGEYVIHLTFGDVVNCSEPTKFGILSGDHLMYRIATELTDVTHCIFAMDEPGILTEPGSNGDLISVWNPELGINGVHNETIDVTGGIFLKAEIAAKIADVVEHVWFVYGGSPELILDIVESGVTTGTKIISKA